MKVSLVSAAIILGLTGCSQHTMLNLNSSERDTSVYLNSKFLGKTPMTGFEIESKKVNTLQFVKEGFKSINQHFQGKEEQFDFVAQLAPLLHVEEILINSSPNGTAIYLDEEYVGATPIEIEVDDLIAKSHTLRLQKKGYDTQLVRIKYKGYRYPV